MEVSNEEYEKALNNNDNIMIMNSVGAKFTYSIDPDEIYRCKLTALWEALKTWKPDGGRKFTAYLYQRVYWECLKSIKTNTQKHTVQVQYIEKVVAPELSIFELLDGLPQDLQNMMEKRCIHKMTLREIGAEHDCCYETIRKRIKKAAKYIKTSLID